MALKKSLLKNRSILLGCLGVLLSISCSPDPPKPEASLYHQYCASCHRAPEINTLPKDVWKNGVLPDMLNRMDLAEMYTDPATIPSGFRPKIKLAEWTAIQNYIISQAPQHLKTIPKQTSAILKGFTPTALPLDTNNGAFFTFLQFEPETYSVLSGNINGVLSRHHFQSGTTEIIYEGETPITWYNKERSTEFITEVGILDPSDEERGKIVMRTEGDALLLPQIYHRPVHTITEDLNKDGSIELVVSEFGNETGRLSLLYKNEANQYERKILLNQPGCLKTMIKDMNNDGKQDVIVMTSQANESITILYQEENLSFRAERVLEFDPVYGSSWFELVDYNNDGFDDLITVNGDNADKSYVHKPYHGLRIHLNNGRNEFTEAYFYPMHGATRFVTDDFDQDGDLDFGILSTFPDYENMPEYSFVYLENKNAENYSFETKLLPDPNLGRWFLMDKGDIDGDGDIDILLSSFTYAFTPVPDFLEKKWSQENTDILILENTLHTK